MSIMEDLVAWADIIGTVAGILVLSSFTSRMIFKARKTDAYANKDKK